VIADQSILTAPFSALRTSAISTGGVFALAGGLGASWVSRLPEIRDHLHADPGALGLALLFGGIGSIFAPLLSGVLSRRLGTRPVVGIMSVVACAATVALALAPSVPVLGVCLFVLGVAASSWDVAMNIYGHAVEHQAERPWMPRYHALFSAGGFLFAGLGVLAVLVRIPIVVHLGAYGLICLASMAWFLRHSVDERPATVARMVQHARQPVERSSLRRRATVLRVVAPLGVILGCATLISGAAGNWLGIYFDTVRHTTAAAAAAAFALYSVAMGLTRWVGPMLITRLGRSTVVRLSGVTSLVGVSVMLLAPDDALAYVGVVLWGIGVASVFPAVISSAGDVHLTSASAISFVTPIGYSGTLFGPPVIGLLARSFGLQNALWLVGALALLVVVLSNATREAGRGEAGDPGQTPTIQRAAGESRS
jgi:MFS family permease